MKSNNLMIGILVIALIAAVSFTVLAPKKETGNDAGTTSATTATKPEQTAITAVPSKENTREYKNGTFEAVGEYTVPGAKEQVGVSVTLTDGIITGVEVQQLAKLPISKMKQADFAENYKVQVVGKNLDEVNLVKVSGSSLTPKGFNDALEKIKRQART